MMILDSGSFFWAYAAVTPQSWLRKKTR